VSFLLVRIGSVEFPLWNSLIKDFGAQHWCPCFLHLKGAGLGAAATASGATPIQAFGTVIERGSGGNDIVVGGRGVGLGLGLGVCETS